MNAFRKILIANRGEIALRIMRTCRALGISPATVYSEADRKAPHARLADEAVFVGSAPSQESYLHIERILEAALRTRADAIHPGYGFLAENADFAAACENSGITFIGPPSHVIRKMGRKDVARRLAADAGVPIVPGWHGENQRPEALAQAAREVGFPLLIKASAGGGGRGMRIVGEVAGLASALESARREAEKAFGDGALLLERYIAGARHVEFQILADADGALLHLFERDCSLQRRHQKIIEESPSPALNDELRKRMGEAAVAVARAIGYRNAGTVEFLLAPSGEFYFIEVNTRIQVEHPVTEMITGLDLVQLQIQVAEALSLGSLIPEPPRPSGHAIEARLYAEDPSNGFLPSTGTIQIWNPPPPVRGLRIDSGVEEGMEVGIYYDPLLAKIIGHGPSRSAALRTLIYGLKMLCVEGVQTNREFLIRLLETEEFREAKVHTRFVDEHPLAIERDLTQDFTFAAVVAAYCEQVRHQRREILPQVPPNYRNNPFCDPSTKFAVGGAALALSWRRVEGNRYVVRSEERQADVEVLSCDQGSICAAIDGIQRTFVVKEAGDQYYVHSSMGSRTIRRLARCARPDVSASRQSANSPMPGQVLRILVEEGQPVKVGDPLVVLEAMKMEQTISSSLDGLVTAVLVKTGEVVAPGQVMVQISGPENANES